MMGSVDEGAVELHRMRLRALSVPGGALDSQGPHASVNNGEWFDRVAGMSAARVGVHDSLIDAHRAAAAGVAQDRKAIVLAGPPGAGKSTVLSGVLGPDADKWMVIDADYFKAKLLDQALEDGTFDGFLKPDEVRAFEEAGDRFFPLELASLVHEESSLLAVRAREEAIRRGDNIVIDSVLSVPAKAEALGAVLNAAGYSVRVVDVETSFEISAARIAARWREQYVAALNGDPDAMLGGRWVPSEYPRVLFTDDGVTARSRESARLLAQTCPAVTRYEVHVVEAIDGRPVKISDLARTHVGGALVEASLAETARRAHPGAGRGSQHERPRDVER